MEQEQKMLRNKSKPIHVTELRNSSFEAKIDW